MRIIRALSDLPWWVGLPIFLIGNFIITIPYIGFVVGICICMFGCWIFSKLLRPDEYASSSRAIICLPIMALSLWFLNEQFIDWMSYGTLYTIRTAIGLFLGFISFQGFTK
jgi:hypothetical protein